MRSKGYFKFSAKISEFRDVSKSVNSSRNGKNAVLSGRSQVSVGIRRWKR